MNVGLLDRVFTGLGLGGGSVVSPVGNVEGEGLVTAVRVQDSVPEGVKVADTADVGVNPVIITTSVALGEL